MKRIFKNVVTWIVFGELLIAFVMWCMGFRITYPIEWIGENPLSESYVIGMPCYRGRLSIPGQYKAEDGRLREVIP